MKARAWREDGLRLEFADADELQAFLASSLWKVRLPLAKSLKPRVEGDTLAFAPDMDLRTIGKLVASLRAAYAYGLDVEVNPRLCAEMDAEGSRLPQLSGMGAAIKRRDPYLAAQLEEFAHVVNDLMVRRLRPRQMWDAFYMFRMGRAANFSVPGSGKTASVLGAFSYLRVTGIVDRVLVICPKNAFVSWHDEWEACFGDRLPLRELCFDAPGAPTSVEARRRELGLGYRRYNLVLMNYEAISYEHELARVASDRCLVVFDEVHKVKRLGGRRAEAALAIAGGASHVLALTGTPIPNSYLDVYNLLHILFPDDYDALFGFTPDQLAHPGSEVTARVNAAIRPFFCRTNKCMLGVPEPEPDVTVETDASWRENEALRRLRRTLKRDPLSLIVRIMQLESDPRMLLESVDASDMASILDEEDSSVGCASVEALFTGEDRAQMRDAGATSKTRACVELVRRLVGEGKRVIVWCVFRRSMANLASALLACGIDVRIICGDTLAEERRDLIRRFKAGRLQVLVTNPHTLAESVSLHTACHDAVYFEYSYNLVHLLQSKDRINRLGLPDGQYTQYYFMQSVFTQAGSVKWSLDRNIYERLREKEQTMLAAIDQDVLEVGANDKDDVMGLFRGFSWSDESDTSTGDTAGEDAADELGRTSRGH